MDFILLMYKNHHVHMMSAFQCVQNLSTLLILTFIFACFDFISEKKLDENKKGFSQRTL